MRRGAGLIVNAHTGASGQSPLRIPGHCGDMSINRHPAGTSVGGQWAPGASGEVDVDLDAGSPSIDLEEDGHYEFGHGDGGPFASHEVTRTDDGEYLVHGTVDEHFHDAIPRNLSLDDEAKNAYVSERDHIVADFVEENYISGDASAELVGSDDGVTGVRFTKGIGHDAPTEQSASDAVWSQTKGADFYNEMDPGTYGSPDMEAELRKRFEVHDQTPLPPVQVSDSDREAFKEGFISSLEQDHQMSYHDERFDDEGYDENLEVELDGGTRARIEAQADRFLDEYSGELDYLARHDDHGSDWSALGHDAYMGAAGHGVGVEDRVSSRSEASVVAGRLSDGTVESWRASDLDIEGSLTVDGTTGKIVF